MFPTPNPRNGLILSPVRQVTILHTNGQFRDSLMVRMGACRVLDRGSIPRRGVHF